jgi:hypothetical protein
MSKCANEGDRRTVFHPHLPSYCEFRVIVQDTTIGTIQVYKKGERQDIDGRVNKCNYTIS